MPEGLMPQATLEKLHHKSIAIDLLFDQTSRLLKGIGHYEPDHEMGAVLRIVVSDPVGEFEVLLKEGQFTGEVLAGDRFGCDYAIQLDSSSLSRK